MKGFYLTKVTTLSWARRGFRVLLLSLITTAGLASIVASGGGGGDTTDRIVVPPAPGRVSLLAIEVTPALPTLASGTSLELVATGVLSDGSTRNYTDKVTWSTSNSNVATAPVDGRVTANSKGSVTLTATLYSKSGSTSLTVTDAILSRLEITPHVPKLAKGTQLNLVALGHYSDGSTQDLTTQVAWATTDAGVAPVSNTDGSKGLLDAQAVGSVTVNASLASSSVDVAVSVSAAELTALAIEPANPSLLLGAGLDLSAMGFYSDGSTQDLTPQVAWASSAPGAVVVGNTPATAGKVVALGLTNPAAVVSVVLGSVSTSTPLTVRAPALQSIEVTPASSTLASGFAQALTALGHFDDGTTQDITAQVIWRSSESSALVVSNANGSEGLVTALGVGNANISAVVVDALGSVLFEGLASLMVTPETLVSIDIEPAAPRIARGTRLALRAIGRYSDGSIQDVTARVSWVSADFLVASIDTTGVVLAAETAGSAGVTAHLVGKTGTATLTVSDAQLQVIDIEPGDIVLAAGTQMRVKAVGGFSDGSHQDLSEQVIWESSRADIAAVSQTGLLSALADGETRIIASFEQISGGARRAGSVAVSVVDASLTAVEITPLSLILAAGTETSLVATASYEDNNNASNTFQQDVTDWVLWHSTDEAVARVDNGAGRAGRLHAVAAGSAAISASFGGLSGDLALTVSNATLTSLSIVAPVTTLPGGVSQNLTAIGGFSDMTSQDLTDQVVWSSLTPTLALVSNASGTRGRVTAITGISGAATIKASWQGQDDTQVLSVVDEPQRPVSLTLLATPDVIENDNIDVSVLTAQLLAADPANTVADGTQVAFTISDDLTVLQTTTVSTSGGTASVNFSTETPGQLSVRAATQLADGSEVSQSTTILSTAQQKDVIIGIANTDAEVSGGNILAGGQFGAFVFNTSNRDFTLLRFVLCNGQVDPATNPCADADILYADNSPNQATGNLLKGGSKFGVVYPLPGDVPNRGVSAIFYLEEPLRNRPFFFRINFY